MDPSVLGPALLVGGIVVAVLVPIALLLVARSRESNDRMVEASHKAGLAWSPVQSPPSRVHVREPSGGAVVRLASVGTATTPGPAPGTVHGPTPGAASGPVSELAPVLSGTPVRIVGGLDFMGAPSRLVAIPPVRVPTSDGASFEQELQTRYGFKREGNDFTGTLRISRYRINTMFKRRDGGQNWEMYIKPSKPVQQRLRQDPVHGHCLFDRGEWLFCHFHNRGNPIIQLQEMEDFARGVLCA